MPCPTGGSGDLELSAIMAMVTTGRNSMPAFTHYTSDELQDIGSYIQQVLSRGL